MEIGMQILLSMVTTILGLWLGSIEWRFRTMWTDLITKPTKDEMAEAIELRQRELKAVQTDIKEDMRRLEEKLDKIYDKLSN